MSHRRAARAAESGDAPGSTAFPAIRRLASVAAALAAYGLARLIFNAFGLRTIGAGAVGMVNLALAFAGLISLPASAGIAPTISRFLPLFDRMQKGAAASFLRRAAGAAVLWTLTAALVFLAAHVLFSPTSGGAGFPLLVLVWAFLYSLYSLSRAELFALDEAGKALALETTGFALFASGLGALYAANLGALNAAGLGAPFAILAISWLPFSLYYLPGAGYVVLRRWKERVIGGPVPFPVAEMRSFGLYALIGSLASLGITYLSTVVVSAAAGLESAGLWATLMSVAAPLLLAPRTLNAAFFPRLSFLGRWSLDAFQKLSAVHQRFSSLLALLFVGTALVLSRPILAVVMGPTGDSLLPSWRMICVASFGIFRGEPVITATGALGRTRVTASAAFAGAGVSLILWLALLPEGGSTGVAIGYMAFALAVPSIVWACARLDRGGDPYPRVVLFVSDALFALIALISTFSPAGVQESAAVQAVLLGSLLFVLAHGARRIWIELKEIPEDALRDPRTRRGEAPGAPSIPPPPASKG